MKVLSLASNWNIRNIYIYIKKTKTTKHEKSVLQNYYKLEMTNWHTTKIGKLINNKLINLREHNITKLNWKLK